MSYLEHEPELENCGCPSCYLMEVYGKAYVEYKTRKAYRVIECSDAEANSVELKLNQMQERGYEMTTDVEGLIILRSVPPLPPNNSDVIKEFTSRKEKLEKRNKNIENFNIEDEDEDFGPVVGSA